MDLFGFTITRRSAATRGGSARTSDGAGMSSPVSTRDGMGGWYPMIREPYTGAWQKDDPLPLTTVVSNPTVFACASLIATDIAKLRLRLVEQDEFGVWTETTNPAYSPVLRTPNRYQTPFQFVQQWITSKLLWGNAYVLKERDQRGVVSSLYVLHPRHVWPLIAPDGSIYYRIFREPMTDIWVTDLDTDMPSEAVVPASEMIHDIYWAPYHPLMGVSPIYACGMAAIQGTTIQQNSTSLFSNNSNPGGILTAPGAISDETAQRIKANWETNYSGANAGKVAVLGDGVTYAPTSMSAADTQLLDQLKWSSKTICGCFRVPPFLLDLDDHPPHFATIEPIMQQYYAQCLQAHLTALETHLDAGLELDPSAYGTEFDVDDLIWMDTATRTKAAGDAIGSGALTPDEARAKYYGLGPVKGGDTPYLQQQYFSLAALAARDNDDPFAKPAPTPAPGPPTAPPEDAAAEAAKFAQSLYTKVADLLYAG
jgi:HK97 family phage portal protein